MITNSSLSGSLEHKIGRIVYEREETKVLKEDHFDIVLCYNANFDSTMHRYGPEAEVSLAQIDHNAKAFQTLVEAAKKTWKGKNAVFAFLPDHGCHEIDGNLGSHGLDMEEDMNIIHFYGFEKG